MKLTNVLITLFLIFLVLFIIYYVDTRISSRMDNHTSQVVFLQTKKTLGPPDFFVPGKNASAKWYHKTLLKKGLPFEALSIKNDTISGCCPVPNEQPMWATILIDVPNIAKLLALIGTSKSFWYDQDKKALYVRCHNIGTAISSFLFATDLLLLDDPTILSLFKNNTDPVATDSLLKRYSDTFMYTYQPYLQKNTSDYSQKVNEHLKQLVDNLSKLPYTKPTTCEGINCDNLASYQNIESMMSSGKTTTFVNVKNASGADGYVDDTLIDGKNYTLGYPYTFEGCSKI